MKYQSKYVINDVKKILDKYNIKYEVGINTIELIQ